MKRFLVLTSAFVLLYSVSFSQDISLAITSQPPSIEVGQQGKVLLRVMNVELDEVAVPVDKIRPYVSFPSSVRVDGANLPAGWSIVSNTGQTIRFTNTSDGPTFVPSGSPRMIEILITGLSVAPAQLIQANLAFNGAYGLNGYSDFPDNNDPTTSITVTATAVPVAYTQDLKADKAGNSVNLSWKTGVESNSKGFAVQRSADGTNYSTLGFVQAKGSNSAYTYSDNAAVSGVNHYRLEQLDADGRKTYSNVVTVNFDGVSGLSVYPNPATTQVTVKATDLVQVYDLSGKLVLSQQPVNGTAVINISKLAKGTYVLKSGKTSGKFVKL